MHEILRCNTCNAIVSVGEEHFHDAGTAWPCPTCGTVNREWVPVQVDLGDPFAPSTLATGAQTQENSSMAAAKAVSLAVT